MPIKTNPVRKKKSTKKVTRKKAPAVSNPIQRQPRGTHLDIQVGDPATPAAQPAVRPKRTAPLMIPQGFAQSRSGVSRAARLLLALGTDQAALILKELETREVEALVHEMVRIDRISASEKKEILAEFQQSVQGFEAPLEGGLEQARRMLEMGLGQEKANQLLGKIQQQDLYKDFDFLERMDPILLANALSQEHVQIAAVALSFLKPRIAANIMKALPEDFRSDVALRIAKTTRIYPEAIQRVARVLREKFEKRSQEEFSEIGGANSLANILNHMDRSQEDEILNILGKQEPDMLEEVKDKLYTFEELVALNQMEMRQLISRINDDELLATALRGAVDELRRHFFNAMSNNRAADILDEMDRRGPLSMREINEARAFVLNLARRMDEEGLLVIKKTKEEYI
ncbi:MAG: flagellar motor switch protein FliG [Leptospiraceae bacterium]|nr:flagellar motor switch protein FliG [Leptospiraceae bacterium]